MIECQILIVGCQGLPFRLFKEGPFALSTIFHSGGHCTRKFSGLKCFLGFIVIIRAKKIFEINPWWLRKPKSLTQPSIVELGLGRVAKSQRSYILFYINKNPNCCDYMLNITEFYVCKAQSKQVQRNFNICRNEKHVEKLRCFEPTSFTRNKFF